MFWYYILMRYFDRTFFKFTLGFLVIIALSLLVMYAASAYAATSKIIILPDEAISILPNTLSGQMTVQSQDENGPAKTTEKINLTFESSSPTGEFFTSTGNSLDSYKYISADTTNRNFSYKDSSEGTFVITVNAIGVNTAEKWTATKQITISSGASQTPPNSNTQSEVAGASTEISATSNTAVSGGSTTNVSSLNSQLEIIAGNDRTTSPGSPIWFQATVKKNTTQTNMELNWSFGDGNVGTGPLVSHTYKYPGDYVVVLSANAGKIFSVSRLKVKVVEPSILVEDKGEYLEILNRTNAEINLFNWKLENEGKGFIFQPNTIILSNGIIRLDKSLLRMKGYDNSEGLCLKNSLGEEVFDKPAVAKIDLKEISQNIESIKNEVLIIQNKIPKKQIVKNLDAQKVETDLVEIYPEVAGAQDVIYEVPKSEGFTTKLTNFIKRVFSR